MRQSIMSGRRAGLAVGGLCIGLVAALVIGTAAIGQTTGNGTTAGNGTTTGGLGGLLQGVDLTQLGGLQTLLDQLQGNGIVTDTGTGTGGTTTTQPSDGTRPPTIVENQFTTTSTEALQARAPGGWIQAAQGLQTGTTEFSGGNGETEQGFFGETFDLMLDAVFDNINLILTGVDAFVSSLSGNPGVNPGGGGTVPGLTNAATTGQGTQTPIQRLRL